MSHSTHPIIAVPLGDPAGVGPELVAKLVAAPAIAREATIVVVGDRWLWEHGQAIAGVRHRLKEISSLAEAASEPAGGACFHALDTVGRDEVEPAVAAASGGRSAIRGLRHCLEAATRGEIDGICFAPLNKLAMKLHGMKFQDELHFFAHELGVSSFTCELNVLERLWTARVTSHVPLRDVAGEISREKVRDCIQLVNAALVRAGCERPRIVVAALNPHAGEGGTCGREEIDLIRPAVEDAASAGLRVEGPLPSDTIFRKAAAGEYDAVVTMYHDQGQIALKLLGAEKGVTVHGGLPIIITTPAQGTAYDIVGQNRADPGATIHAVNLCARMAARAKLTPGSQVAPTG